MHFGDWLTGLITGWLVSHGNEEQLWQLENLAAQAAAGGPQHVGPACSNPMSGTSTNPRSPRWCKPCERTPDRAG